MTDTARQIIGRAMFAKENAAEFRAQLIKQAEMHDDYAKLTRDHGAYRGAIAQRSACLRAYDAVGRDDLDAILSDCGTMVVALNVAAKLQGLPAHVRTAAAVAWDEGTR